MPYRFNPFSLTLDFYLNPGTGDVTGPGSSTDKAIARFNGTTGKIIQDSKTIVQDGGAIEAQGFISRRSITDVVTVNTKETWIMSGIELELTGAIQLEPDAEIVIV